MSAPTKWSEVAFPACRRNDPGKRPNRSGCRL